MSVLRISIIFAFCCVLSAETGSLEKFNRWFGEESAWTGGDGAYTIELNENRVLWVFGDTLFGKIRNGVRQMENFINNSIAIQQKTQDWQEPQFIIPRNEQGEIQAFFRPPDNSGWFWPLHGISNENGLFIFLLQIKKSNTDQVFAFRIAANWLACIDNPEQKPELWNINYQKLPWYQPDKRQLRMFGNYVLNDNGKILIYGIEEKEPNRKYLLLAGADTDKLGNTEAWSFYRFGSFVKEVKKSSRLMKNMPIEFTIHKKSGTKLFALTAMAEGLSPKILRRYAPGPAGPWSKPVTVYECPEVVKEPTELFCYAAKTHPFLSEKPEEEVFTYVVNSFRPERVEKDAALYLPRFVLLSD